MPPTYFGEWLKQRREQLDLTQAQLAQRAYCSTSGLRKIEAGVRQPSSQLAGMLAKALEISSEDHSVFVRVARGELSVERLPSSARTPSLLSGSVEINPPSSGNLPEMLTPFVGRETELASLAQMLLDPQCRLLTLTGHGGVGKTRGAVEIGTRLADVFPDGVWLVPLAPLRSSAYIVPAIADALNFRFQGPANPEKQLLSYLRNKKAMLVLDNAEHLLDGTGLFAQILASTQHVKLLVTSREKLNLLGEWVFEIHGLPVPPGDQTEQFEEYSSVALFMQSARRNQADFKLGEPERPWVAHICQIVGGLPLAIELAAAWVGMLSCEEIAREIARNFDFLAVSLRGIPQRHRSMRATLDYSWNMLNPEEQVILSRLSIFDGSFRREVAEAICGANLAVLTSLRNKSLLRRTEKGRYDLHELIRQYAGLKLAEDASEEERVKDAHTLYYAQRLSVWQDELKTSRQVENLNEMEDEIDNLRQAWQGMTTCFDTNCSTNTLSSLSLFQSSLFSLSLFLELRCRNGEAISLFEGSIKSLKDSCCGSETSAENQDFNSMLGQITAYLGLHYAYNQEYPLARKLLEEALALLESKQTRVEKARANIMLGSIVRKQGELQKSVDLFEQARIVLKEEGDIWWYTLSLSALGYRYFSIGKTQESKVFFQEAIQLVDPGDLRLSLPIRDGLANVAYIEGDYIEAERLLQENLKLSFHLGFKREIATIYAYLARVMQSTGRFDEAKGYYQQCVDLYAELGELCDQAIGLIYFGKLLAACQETEAARKKILNAIRIARSLNIFHLIYWGLVILARIDWLEGQPEKALETTRVLRRYSVESQIIRDDFDRLLLDLDANLPPEQITAVTNHTEGMTIEALLASL